MRVAAAARPTVIALAIAMAAGAHPVEAGWSAGPGASWQGFYVGGNLGEAFDGSKLSIFDLSGDGLSIKADTQDQFIGGVHLGYNLQGAHILYGIEGDADFSQDISFLGSIRGRLGWAGERVLVYGTAGVGFVNADANFTISSLVNPPTKLSHEISEVAFVVGGGLDFKVLPRLSLGAEGLFYDFANDEAHLTAAGAPFLFHDHPDMTVVRGRITYYFNPSY
jgi:outer membrane immunogenic protein